MTRLFAKEIKYAFQAITRHHLRRLSEHNEVNFAIMCPTGRHRYQRLTGTVTFAHGHWTPTFASAILRVDNLPVQSKSGSGVLDFLILIIPIRPVPKIMPHQIEVNRVSRFKGRAVTRFVKEFCTDFAKDWG